MSLVIAWSVCTDEETTPIGIEELLKFEGDFIFYNKDINKWTVPEDCSGFGFQTLQEYVDEGR
jgi:hypothetical protein